MKRYVLGIDNGSTVIKASVFDLSGGEMGVSAVACETLTPRPGWYERDTESIWRASAEAVRGAIGRARVRPEDIAAASLTGHGNGAHLVDASGRGVRNSIEGADCRALGYVEKRRGDGSFQRFTR